MNRRSPADVTLLPRDLRFDVSAARARHWLGGDPVATAVLNVLSLTFPDGERMFMEAVRAHRDRVSGKLAEDVKDFIAQEAMHSREHHMLNQGIDRDIYPVADIEAALRKRIAFVRSRGPMLMLVATICLEHFTAMLADMFATHEDPLFAKTDPELVKLWRWHALEETEHKGVAYDVFLEVTRDWPPLQRYFRRCKAMLVISFFFPRKIARLAALMLEADGYSPKAAKRAVHRFLWKDPNFFGRGWKVWISWFRPGFHPWDHDNRALLDAWRTELTPATAA